MKCEFRRSLIERSRDLTARERSRGAERREERLGHVFDPRRRTNRQRGEERVGHGVRPCENQTTVAIAMKRTSRMRCGACMRSCA